jgi:hypothetical protein
VLLVRYTGQHMTAACRVASVHCACPCRFLSSHLLKGTLNVTGNVTGMLKGTKATAPLPAFVICTALTAVQTVDTRMPQMPSCKEFCKTYQTLHQVSPRHICREFGPRHMRRALSWSLCPAACMQIKSVHQA